MLKIEEEKNVKIRDIRVNEVKSTEQFEPQHGRSVDGQTEKECKTDIRTNRRTDRLTDRRIFAGTDEQTKIIFLLIIKK